MAAVIFMAPRALFRVCSAAARMDRAKQLDSAIARMITPIRMLRPLDRITFRQAFFKMYMGVFSPSFGFLTFPGLIYRFRVKNR